MYVFESIEFSLVNLGNDALIINCKNDMFICEFWREIGQISFRLQARSVGWRYLFLLQQFPFYHLEKWVCHDLHEARAGFAIAAQSVHGVLVQEAFEDGGRFHAK